MTAYPRYGLYYVPAPDHALYRFGSQLLGYDATTGADVPIPGDLGAAVPDWPALTRDPRRYGFHATLKAPLSLAAGTSEDELRAAGAAFAAAPRTIPIIRPAVSLLDGFIAVAPAETPEALIELAASCVRHFERFRAPLTAADRERRQPATLTRRQVAHLDRWGYPFVMEDFRFHMTLTGRLPAERQAPLLDLLQERFACLDLPALPIDRLALLRQDASGSPFRIGAHWRLEAS